MAAGMNDARELHSGDYVRRFETAPLSRIAGIVERLDFPDDADVCDFGCGTGMLLHALGPRRGSYTGVDFSADFIESARRWAMTDQLSNYEFVEAEIIEFCQRYPLAFDIATALDFTEHIETPLAVQILSAIRTSLRPGGSLILHTPNLDFFIERAKQVGILRQFPEHIAVRTAYQMRQLLCDSGFSADAIKVAAIPHYNILKILHPLSYLPAFGRFFQARLLIRAIA